MTRLCVVPARGGSKRIPGKNIKPFCGKPMIAWSIEAAQASGCFDRIVVSTDDLEIANTARTWGAEVPFMRPQELADDHTSAARVIQHAVEWFDEQRSGQREALDYVCCLFATAPFVSPEDLRTGLELLLREACSYAFSVARYTFPVQRAIKIKEDGRMEMFHPEHFTSRSQDLEEAWHDAGQFYWGTAEAWRQGTMIFGQDSVPVKLPAHRVQDIDTAEDWTRAEWLFRAMQAEAKEG